jgi:pyrimidine-specific ribonucleoside hydrolase
MGASVHAVVDGGLDDALALGVLFGLKVPIAQVIATEGSLDLRTTAATTRRLVATFGSSVPVRLGADRGLAGPYPEGRDPFHGPDGFGGRLSLLEPAASPAEAFHRLDGPVFCTGALTVVARGLAAGHPVTEVVWMGGAAAVGGNMTAAAEFNAWMDPPATDRVLQSGIPLRMVPLDVTSRFRWSHGELEALRSAGRLGSLLALALSFAQSRDQVFVPHDAVAAIAMTTPELFTWKARPARCETTGSLTAGATVIDRRPHAGAGHVLVAEDVDVAEVTGRILEAIRSLGEELTEDDPGGRR